MQPNNNDTIEGVITQEKAKITAEDKQRPWWARILATIKRQDHNLEYSKWNSMISHLKPFNVASIHIANVSNMIINTSTRSGSLLNGFSPATSFHTELEFSMVSSSNQPTYWRLCQLERR